MEEKLGPLFIITILVKLLTFSSAYGEEWSLIEQKITVNIQSWGPDCGTEPRSYVSKQKRRVEIYRTQDGNISIGRHHTKSCWSDNPKVVLKSIEKDENLWIIECETPPTDPKIEKGKYIINLVDNNTIKVKLLSNYDWRLKNDHCMVTVIMESTYVKEEVETEKVSTQKEERCREGEGKLKYIILKPQSLILSPAGKVCFKVEKVMDNGCHFKLDEKDIILEIKGKGVIKGSCYYAPESINLKEEVEVKGTYLKDHNIVVKPAVISIKEFKISDLLMGQLEDDEKELQTTFKTLPKEQIKVFLRSDKKTENKKTVLLYITITTIGVIVIIGGSIGVIITKEKMKREKMATQNLNLTEDKIEERKICPTCRRGYLWNTDYCIKDKSKLIPYREWLNLVKKEEELTKKRCPLCNEVYYGDVEFCWKDGSKLLPLNKGKS